jgi:hypothetical protein
MRVYDNGSLFTVLCTERDVYDFSRKWPCFGTVRSYWFQYEKRNGDLVDTNHQDGESDNGGILALSQDARDYGAKRLRLHF